MKMSFQRFKKKKKKGENELKLKEKKLSKGCYKMLAQDTPHTHTHKLHKHFISKEYKRRKKP